MSANKPQVAPKDEPKPLPDEPFVPSSEPAKIEPTPERAREESERAGRPKNPRT